MSTLLIIILVILGIVFAFGRRSSGSAKGFRGLTRRKAPRATTTSVARRRGRGKGAGRRKGRKK